MGSSKSYPLIFWGNLMVRLTFKKEMVERLKRELALVEKLNNLHLYKITTCLLLIQEGEKFSTIAKQLNICCRTVYNWFKNIYCPWFFVVTWKTLQRSRAQTPLK